MQLSNICDAKCISRQQLQATLDILHPHHRTTLRTTALVDSGAIGANFVDINFVKSLNIEPLDRMSGRVKNADGSIVSPGGNGRFYELTFTIPTMGQVEPIIQMFRAIPLANHRLILGMPWLERVNPSINWREKTMSITENIQVLSAEEFTLEGEGEKTYSYQITEEPVKVHLPREYEDYADVFDEQAESRLPPHRDNLDHAINLTPGSTPPFGPLYNLSETELQVLKEYIDKNLASGFIKRSNSPAGAPILFVKKKDGSLRLCVDYRRLNAITIKDKYPIPLVSEILNRLAGSRYFTKLDLRGAYNLLRIKKGDEWKTTFRSRYGSFEYNVMPFGLVNAPATFQSYIDRALQGLVDEIAIVYLDDILVYSLEEKEHHQHVRKVLQRLREHELFVKLEKCTFCTTSVEYLGFIITNRGISMDPKRTSTIAEWPVPETIKEIQSFLGFCNFYRRFIHRYSAIAGPMTSLTKKDRFEWNQEAQESFRLLKQAFQETVILVQFNPEGHTRIETDASEGALACIISQKQADGHWKPVAFHSRKLKPPEQNYVLHDKEMLAIVEAFVEWRHYCEGAQHQIVVMTDHNNLRWFLTTKQLSRRQAHWAEMLSSFNFVIEYRPGKRNPADAPSRRPDYQTEDNPYRLAPFFTLATCFLNEVDETLNDVCEDLRLCAMEEELSEMEKKYYSTSLLDEIKEGQTTLAEDEDLSDVKSKLTTRDGLIYFESTRLYVPKNSRVRVLKGFHDTAASGHLGRDKTLAMIKHWFYWPHMSRFIDEYVRTCDACNRTKTPRHLTYGELMPLPAPDRPWSDITLDFITDLPKSASCLGTDFHDSIMVVVDRFTKMAHYSPCTKTLDSKQFSQLIIRDLVARHGLPERIVSDRGSLFTSHFWKTLTASVGTDHKLSTSFHPQTDGQTERQNQVLEQYLRCYTNFHQDNWVDLLPLSEYSYNSAENSTLKMSPFMAYTGRQPAPFQLHPYKSSNSAGADEMAKEIIALQSELTQRIKEAQNFQAMYYDRNHKPLQLEIGNRVMLRATHLKTERPCKKLDHKLLGPYEVIQKIGLQAYKLKLPPSHKMHPVFHVSLLEPHHENRIPNRITSPPPPIGEVTEEGVDEREYEVERILKSKRHYGKIKYYVKWKGYDETPEAVTWEPIENLTNAQDLVDEFHKNHPMMPRP